ncbi:MAG: hypothetical protein LBR69_07605 [Endomicrobium sp.]|nr:hypothetical protein [Endomicrobium sp.]
MRKVLLAVCSVLLFAGSSFAAATPVKLSLWNKIAVPASDTVYGVEIGIGTYTPEFKGVAWNAVYARTDNGLGVQMAAVTSTTKFGGLQYGLVNFGRGSVAGAQIGFLNKSKVVKGLQCGFFNMAEDMTGLQFGFINKTEKMKGLQLGLVNIIKRSPLKFMVFANAKF